MITRRTLLLSLPAVAISLQAARAESARTGEFTGRSRHVTTGGATLNRNTLTLEDDFTLDRAPDPIVGLGKNGTWDPATFMGELMNDNGKQTYTSPPTSTPPITTPPSSGAAPRTFPWASRP